MDENIRNRKCLTHWRCKCDGVVHDATEMACQKCKSVVTRDSFLTIGEVSNHLDIAIWEKETYPAHPMKTLWYYQKRGGGDGPVGPFISVNNAIDDFCGFDHDDAVATGRAVYIQSSRWDLTIKSDKKIIARCVLRAERDAPCLSLWSMRTLRNLRRRGNATKLIEACKKLATQRDKDIVLRVRRDNKPAVNLYLKNGFKSREPIVGKPTLRHRLEPPYKLDEELELWWGAKDNQ